MLRGIVDGCGHEVPQRVLTIVYALIALVFGIGVLCLLGLAAMQLWEAVAPFSDAPLAARAALAIERASGSSRSR